MENSAAPLGVSWCRAEFGHVWLCQGCISVCLASGWTRPGSRLCLAKVVALLKLWAGSRALSCPWRGAGLGAQPLPGVPVPAGAARCTLQHLRCQGKPATGLPGRSERTEKKSKCTDQNSVSCANGQVKRDTARANVVVSLKVHKLVHVAAVNRGEPPRNPEFHL